MVDLAESVKIALHGGKKGMVTWEENFADTAYYKEMHGFDFARGIDRILYADDTCSSFANGLRYALLYFADDNQEETPLLLPPAAGDFLDAERSPHVVLLDADDATIQAHLWDIHERECREATICIEYVEYASALASMGRGLAARRRAAAGLAGAASAASGAAAGAAADARQRWRASYTRTARREASYGTGPMPGSAADPHAAERRGLGIVGCVRPEVLEPMAQHRLQELAEGLDKWRKSMEDGGLDKWRKSMEDGGLEKVSEQPRFCLFACRPLIVVGALRALLLGATTNDCCFSHVSAARPARTLLLPACSSLLLLLLASHYCAFSSIGPGPHGGGVRTRSESGTLTRRASNSRMPWTQ